MNPAPQRRRRHRSRSEKQRIVDEWAASGRSSHAFAEEAGLCASNLWRWKRELATSGASSLVPIVVRADLTVDEAQDPPRSAHLELVAHGGRVLRVFAGCDQGLLRAVLAVAEEASPC